jgi:hypothetical protein
MYVSVVVCLAVGSILSIEHAYPLLRSQGEHQNLILLFNEDQDVIFNSFTDHFLSHAIFDLENLVVDICVPRDKEHFVLVRDQLGGTNGFQDGVLSIFVDRVLFETVEGDFGTETLVTIPAQIGASTSAPVIATASPTTESASPTSQPTVPTAATVPSAAVPTGVASVGATVMGVLLHALFQ